MAQDRDDREQPRQTQNTDEYSGEQTTEGGTAGFRGGEDLSGREDFAGRRNVVGDRVEGALDAGEGGAKESGPGRNE